MDELGKDNRWNDAARKLFFANFVGGKNLLYAKKKLTN